MALEAGISAPDFRAETDEGKLISLNDFKDKWLILYFYPKDNTSGCTKEACSFRDNFESITDENAVIVGVSPDSVKSHTGFKDKHSLNFTLIADPEKTICKLYDIIGEKSMYGKKYMGVIRTTYIIDPQGIIRYVFSKVKVDGHIEEVKKILSDLKRNN